jgi:CRP/FNR family transcriptional regulator, cyclic AMP receptor protein
MTQQQRQRGVVAGSEQAVAPRSEPPPRGRTSAAGIDRAAAAGFAPESFLAKLSESEREALFALGILRSYPRGAVLMFQDERDDRMIFLVAGRTKVARIERDGRELMLDLRDPGDLLGELAFIDGAPRAATVTALEPVQAVVMAAGTLRAHLETTPRVALALLEVVAQRFRDSSANRAHFGVADTLGRLAARIVDLADRYGEPCAEGVRVASPLSQEDLAAWTGASRAGVAEALRTLRELGWLATEGKSLTVLNLSALRVRAA